MKQLMLYCRAGFEKECAGEIQDKATQLEVYGFPRVKKNSGYVVFECYQDGDAEKLVKGLDFSSLIFARQMFAVAAEFEALPSEDRISPILAELSEFESFPRCGDLRIETPDTNEAKELLKFCRKFTVPMRQALRGKGLMWNKDNAKKPVLHICFVAPGHCYVGYSLPGNNSQFFMGIPRLKFPADAPSRSTLKLEEAFHVFIPRDEWDERLAPGMVIKHRDDMCWFRFGKNTRKGSLSRRDGSCDVSWIRLCRVHTANQVEGINNNKMNRHNDLAIKKGRNAPSVTNASQTIDHQFMDGQFDSMNEYIILK